jgi:nucleoside-diphosphate-sugar epimerase
MPARSVAVVGGAGHIGRAVSHHIASTDAQIVVVDRHDRLTPAVADASAIVHLAGGLAPHRWESYQRLNVESLRRTLAAAGAGAGRRFVLLSFPGADPEAGNAYLRAKGVAEELLLASDFEPVILRTCHVFGPPGDPGALVNRLLTHGCHPVTELGSGHQRWAPIYVDDVADVIARAALDPRTPTGTFELGGPQTMSVDDFVDRVNGRCVPKHHLDGMAARVASYIVPELSPTMEEILVGDCVVRDNAAARFGVALHPVSEVWPQHQGAGLEPWAPALFPA